MRVAGVTSGSGKSLWSAYALQKEMEKTYEGCPFEIVGMFSGTRDSEAVSKAIELGIPHETVDIRAFYEEKQLPFSNKDARREYDTIMLHALEKWKPDVIMLAGYVWFLTDVISSRYPVYGTHPGDLTLEKDGVRLLAGANAVKKAFELNLPELRSSAYIVTNDLDGGPVVITSPPVPVDYSLHSDENKRFRYYLGKVNDQNRLTSARLTLEIASGNIQVDEHNKYYYKGRPLGKGIKLESWDEYPPSFKRSPEKLINPGSIAVIGASKKPGIGHAVVQNLIDFNFNGKIYPVNVRAEDVCGLTGCSSVLNIPGDVDMAVVAVSSKYVTGVVEECGKKGVKGIVCIAAGFKEVGGDGVEMEHRLIDIINHYGMCMTGPNCMGVINTGISMNATMLASAPKVGNVAMLTQSGALGAAMEDFCGLYGIGFSVVVSLGNQADMNICDFLPLVDEDPNTKVVLLYIEGLDEPQRFRNIVKKMQKPVVVFKSGKTSVGAAAAGSHTGSIAGNSDSASALLDQSGAINCKSLEDAFRLAATLSKIDMIRGNRIGIVSNTGGLDIIMADALTKKGFVLPQLPDESAEYLRPLLLPEASVRNPIDIVAPATPEQYRVTTEVMTTCGAFDGIIVTVVPAATVLSEDIAAAVAPVINRSPIPALSCFFGPEVAGKGAAVMKQAGIPSFEYPEKMADICSYLYKKPAPKYSGKLPEYDEALVHEAIIAFKKAESGSFADMKLCEKMLSAYGIPVARSRYIVSPEDVDRMGISYPVVAKIDHERIVHKSDAGGVRLNIRSAEELKVLVDEWSIKFKGMKGILVQEQISGKIELFIGCVFDRSLGHSILAGMGGTLVELTKDISFGHVPVDGSTAAGMIQKLRHYKQLEGYRGEKGVDIPALEEIILRANRMIADNPRICEMDINPLIYDTERNAFAAVDFRIRVSD